MTPADHKKAQLLAKKGLTLFESGRSNLAFRLFDQAVSLAPNDPDILFLLGSTYLSKRELKKASDIYEKVTGLCWEDPKRLLSLLRPLNAAGHPERSLEALRQVRKLTSPKDFHRLTRTKTGDVIVVAESLTRHGREDLAREAYLTAVEVFPEAFPARHMLWLHQLRMGELKGALETVNAVETYDVPDQEATRNRYRALVGWALDSFDAIPKIAADNLVKANGKPVFVYALSSWGDDYIKLTENSLRSLAAPNNFPALAEKFDLYLFLVTTADSLATLKNSGVIELFEDILTLVPLVMPDEVVYSKEHLQPTPLMYYTYSIAMHLGVALAKEMQGAVAPLFADALFADGSWRYISELIGEGYEAVCGTCPACNREAINDAIQAFQTSDGIINLTPDDLMGLAGENLHIIVTSALVSPRNHDFSCPPGILYWRNGSTLAAHGFHIHPLYISAKALATYDAYRFTSMDGHLCLNVFPNAEDWPKVKIITDTRSYGLVSLTSIHQESITTKRPFSIDVGRQYLEDKSMIAPFNQWMFEQKIEFMNVFPEGSVDEYNPRIVERILASEKEEASSP